MDSGQFQRHLEQSQPAPVYLFQTDSAFLVDQCWRSLLDRLVPPAHRRWNGERLAAEDTAAAEVLTRLRTVPMLGGRRLLLVQHVDQWKKADRALVDAYLAKPRPTATLALSIGTKASWKKLFTAVEAVGILVQLQTPTQQTAPRWVRERAMSLGKRLPFAAAAALVEQVGADLQILEQELEKACTFVGERPEITLEDVFQIVSRQRTFGIFELTRAIGSKRPELAIAALRNLLLMGEAPLAMLGLLARHIRLIWQIKEAWESKQNPAETAKRVKLPAGVVKTYADQGRAFGYSELRQIHRALAAADLDLKRTALAPERVLEALVLQLCRITAGSSPGPAAGTMLAPGPRHR